MINTAVFCLPVAFVLCQKNHFGYASVEYINKKNATVCKLLY